MSKPLTIVQLLSHNFPPAHDDTNTTSSDTHQSPDVASAHPLLNAENKEEMDVAGDGSDFSEEEFFEMDGAGDDSGLSEEEEEFFDVPALPIVGITGWRDHAGDPEEESDMDADQQYNTSQGYFMQAKSAPYLSDLTKYITKDEDRPVARGGFGEVWKCTYQSSQRPIKVAVKALLLYASDYVDEAMTKKTKKIQRELGILARLHHQNILPVLGYTYGFGRLMAIVTPWAENGNLTTYLQREHDTLTVVRRFRLLRDIAAGIHYLHVNNIIHGDLTGLNVLIHADDTACLADFGLSLMYIEDNISVPTSFHGNLPWMAPELLREERQARPNKQSDIYSFGGIMLQVLTSKAPYFYLRQASIMLCIHTGKKPERLHYPVLSDNYWHFMEQCWSTATHDRPSIERVVKMIKDELESLSKVSAVPAKTESHSSVAPEEVFRDITDCITKVEDVPVARGGFGEIWKCIYHTGRGPINVAVKSLLTYTSDQADETMEKLAKRIRRELKICSRLHHENILPVYGYTYGFGKLMAIVNLWVENGNLTAYLERENEALTVVRRFQLIRDTAAGLQYLHANGVVHGHLAAPNVLIHGNGTACLADFGLSLVYSDVTSVSTTSWTSTSQGDLRSMAPELLGDPEDGGVVRPTQYTDIYSLGSIMLQVLTGKLPYYYLRDIAVIICICDGKMPDRSRYPAISDKYWYFIEQCYSNVPEDRPSAGGILETIKDELQLESLSKTSLKVIADSSVPPEEMLQDLTSHIAKLGDYPDAFGGFGEIWRCIYHRDRGPVHVAVKSLRVYASDYSDNMERKSKRLRHELSILTRLHHENILHVYGYTLGFGPLMAIVTPWAENGNLTTYLNNTTLTLVRRFQILRDIVAGLQYLHANDVIHGSLTGTDVLIRGNGTACLADFGDSLVSSDVVSITEAYSIFPVNIRWSAPELLEGSEDDLPIWPTRHSDVYSFGGIMLQVITNKIPYYYLSSDVAVTKHVFTGEKPSRSRYPGLPDKYWHFINECWSTARDRPSTDKVVEVIRGELDSLSSADS